jgi:hypothetical protein
MVCRKRWGGEGLFVGFCHCELLGEVAVPRRCAHGLRAIVPDSDGSKALDMSITMVGGGFADV